MSVSVAPGSPSARSAPSVSDRAVLCGASSGGTPLAFDRYGTVREARGFTSSTYTTSSLMAYWTFMRPTTFSARAMRRV